MVTAWLRKMTILVNFMWYSCNHTFISLDENDESRLVLSSALPTSETVPLYAYLCEGYGIGNSATVDWIFNNETLYTFFTVQSDNEMNTKTENGYTFTPFFTTNIGNGSWPNIVSTLMVQPPRADSLLPFNITCEIIVTSPKQHCCATIHQQFSGMYCVKVVTVLAYVGYMYHYKYSLLG